AGADKQQSAQDGQEEAPPMDHGYHDTRERPTEGRSARLGKGMGKGTRSADRRTGSKYCPL
ncbi:MAG: hypothetical protein ACPG8N_10535, partial [Rhodothermales bacterium]